ncbi:MAG TPA: hypothetical protein VFY51_00230 [Pyrinomonadaceae bacterium]|nr:hypothetical protein [Pyrinomonadaceae bacterium]
MKKAFVLIALIFFVCGGTYAQTDVTAQTEVEKLTKSADLLRQLYSEGLIARVELEKAEQELAAAKTREEETQKAEELAKKANELAKAQPAVKTFVKPTLMPLGKTSTVLRSTAGSWSLGNLGAVQQFFSTTFGKALPVSTIGQSATHNRMGWDHRHAVDVGLHPDSNEGRALIAYLQNSGIPFLAFRGAVPGVSTGPHIHIGSPSHRL